MFVWRYSKKRRFVNFVLESLRFVTTRLPHSLVKGMSFVGAFIDMALVQLYRILRLLPVAGSFIESITPARIKLYSLYPFQVHHADWFDRLAAPVRFYYTGAEVEQLLRDVGLSDVSVAPTGLYGWRGCGTKGGSHSGADGPI